MRTAGKIVAGIVAVVVVTAIGVVVLVSTVDLDALIGPVKDRVKAATGRDLTVNGGARVALSLEPKVVLRDVALSNAPWGTAKTMLSAERAEVELALLPLLSRRFEIKEVTLVAPVIALETSATGQKNWEIGSAAPPAPGSTALPSSQFF